VEVFQFNIWDFMKNLRQNIYIYLNPNRQNIILGVDNNMAFYVVLFIT